MTGSSTPARPLPSNNQDIEAVENQPQHDSLQPHQPTGPQIPPELLAKPAESTPKEEHESIGPQIPPAVFSEPAQTATAEGEDEDEYAPALPPDLLAARQGGHATREPAGKRTIGPTFPPSMGGVQRSYEDEEDEDDYGPRPLPGGVVLEEKDAVQEFLEKEERRRKQMEEASKPKALKREEWMLVPPSSSDLLASIDPTKLNRPRQFARTAAPARNTDSSLWTETPAERQQRIADEVAGKRRRVTDVNAVSPDEEREMRKRRRHEEEVRRGVEEHTKKVRGGALLEQHSKVASTKEGSEGEEGPSVIWDHSRDMALSGRLMDDKSRDKLIKEARGLGDRFGTGKKGSFL
ncbi:uncharacterized protein LAESUDRAFT_723354 [Laetiporus sulphureus 93-53]|uniref:DUF3752 domain-containing protein n=1 Tax=Laetiporus sulphureus 93-53 TaxID=1314785 RepID=A0A165FJ86_9APHY|nr:uncharacterized protein LAESUDRAFT_723354 [Laetiporus sulphureus 93-53]KZT09055.1 hypothetical protein LAESUDRAFT_723354 [Laetiporus sulphureus 93-53]